MTRILATWLCVCASALMAVADEPKTNQPPGVAKKATPPTAASTDAQPSLATMRAEFEEISGKLQGLQKQATNAPAVKTVMAEFEAARKEYQAAQKKLMDLQTKLRETVIEEVTKEDPSAKQLIDRQQELIKQIRAAGPPSAGLTNRTIRAITTTNQPPGNAEPKPAGSN